MSRRSHETYMHAAQQEAREREQAQDPTGDETVAVADLPDNLEALCREHICPACPEKAAADEERLRAMAEMENFKKRLLRERDEQQRYAAERVLADVLPTLDNLDLALQYGGQHEACKDMLTGVQMTRKILGDALHQHGLSPVGEVGEPFTPERHEAIAFEERNDMPEGMVSSVMQQGYMLKDRLLRPAKVSVSKRS